MSNATGVLALNGRFPLFAKEWRQLLHKPSAILSAVLFPVMFLLVLPVAMTYFGGSQATNIPSNSAFTPPGLADLQGMTAAGGLREFMLPMFVAIVGLFEPSVLAIYSIVTEKERKTIDLLLALPLSLSDIVMSKLAAIVTLAMATTVPLVVIDFILLGTQGMLDATYVITMVIMLLGAIGFSTAVALALGLAAKDYRTASNISGIFLGPVIVVVMAFHFLLPMAWYRPLLLAALFAILGTAVLWLCFKRFTLERMAL